MLYRRKFTVWVISVVVILPLFISSSLWNPASKVSILESQTARSPITIFNGIPVFGRGRTLYILADGHCWKKVANIGDVHSKIEALQPYNDKLIIGTYYSGIYTYEGGVIEKEKQDFLTIGQDKAHVYALGVKSSTELLVGTIGHTGIESALWTWDLTYPNSIWKPETDFGFPTEVLAVQAIIADIHTSPDTFYIGTRQGGIYNFGPDKKWKRMEEKPRRDNYPALHGVSIQQIAISTFSRDHIVYSVSGGGFEGSSGLYRLFPDDAEPAWESAPGDQLSPEDDVWAVAPDIDPTYPQGVWVGSDSGLFYSTSAGDDWLQITLPSQSTRVLGLLIHNDMLIAITDNHVYETSISSARTQSASWILDSEVSDVSQCSSHATETVTPAFTITPLFPTVTNTETPALSQAIISPTVPIIPSAISPTPSFWATVVEEIAKTIGENIANILFWGSFILLGILFGIIFILFKFRKESRSEKEGRFKKLLKVTLPKDLSAKSDDIKKAFTIEPHVSSEKPPPSSNPPGEPGGKKQ